MRETGDVFVRRAGVSESGGIARVMESNGIPRWTAYEGSFLVAGRGDEILGAVEYGLRYEKVGRLALKVPVVEPWAGEREIFVALYRAAAEVARQAEVSEVRAESVRLREYAVAAGYERGPSGWRLRLDPDGHTRPRFAKKILQFFGRTPVPGV
ncbi:MAG: hypothetical protein ACR2KW_00380 [Rubrobacter sp.]